MSRAQPCPKSAHNHVILYPVSWHQRVFRLGKDYEEVAAETCGDEDMEDEYGEELKWVMMLHEYS